MSSNESKQNNETAADSTVSSRVKAVLNHLNTRPYLSLYLTIAVVLDVAWLHYVNYFSSVWTYFEYEPVNAYSILAMGVIAIVLLVKGVDK
ncbi:MAG: hypothetical protein JKY55_19150 [Aliivibrio sp.]|uniref:hypothetical protein n=1 Tax=Aliivibrio sp. TaxID=1872443 RepID=UPI001A437B0D|nr:hypothetical protein [Aliivibrio sp.]